MRGKASQRAGERGAVALNYTVLLALVTASLVVALALTAGAIQRRFENSAEAIARAQAASNGPTVAATPQQEAPSAPSPSDGAGDGGGGSSAAPASDPGSDGGSSAPESTDANGPTTLAGQPACEFPAPHLRVAVAF